MIDINCNLEVSCLSQKEIEFAVFCVENIADYLKMNAQDIYFCVENIADYLKMNAQDIYQLLGVKSRILFDYIVPSYEPLHTQSKEYIINEIVDMMKQKELI